MTDLMVAFGTDSDGFASPLDTSRRWQEHVDAYQRALWAGDHREAERVARRALDLGEGLAAVYERVITPAMHQVGVLWSTGELTAADEHTATEATQRAMAGVYALADEFPVHASARRCIVTTTAEGERHGVGLRMAADTLELAGHDVVHCGVDTPTDDLIALARSSRADAVAISFTMASSGDNLAATAARIWRTLPGLPLLVGGQGLPGRLPEGPIEAIGGLEEMIEAADRLPVRRLDGRPVECRDPFVAAATVSLSAEVAARPAPRPEKPTPNYLRAIFDGADEAMATLDSDGIVTSWNRGAELLWGRPAAVAIGSQLGSLGGAPTRSRMLRRRFREVMAGTTVEARETDISPIDFSERELALRFIPVREGDEIAGAALIAREVGPARAAVEAQAGGCDHRLWHNRIEHALAEDRFVFSSQPIVDLATDEVDHCELLLRMKMGGRTVMPGEFIPPAERSGQIREIDLWVAKRGIELATEHPVAINLSGASLSSHALIATIEDTLARVEADPEKITFEITETAAAQNVEEAAALVSRLRELGCRVALDDFGTGFGSFTYLSRLPVTELKIDGEFTRGIRDGAAEGRVVDAVVSVGRAFGIRTVAEGVEDAGTLAILREAGVDLGQGWLFGKPAPIETAVA
jgi:EAL domain-containing protein (putative c-di-GMP-specific phosphodiesterase class I)/methanogenic corrinoid protein MtbC1